MKFYKWLLARYGGHVGGGCDLAMDARDDEDFPRKGGKRQICEYLKNKGASDTDVWVFKRCWAEYTAFEKWRRRK